MKVRGCAATGFIRRFVTTFKEGDIVFNVAKARRGILEKIVVKQVRRITSRRTLGQRVALYQDTLNWLWNEYDLVPYEEAVELIHIHHDAMEADLNRLMTC